ncbi:MAG: SRPBCC family protein [Fimbriimonadaceae bacterium]|nr:SRPBCC family protein [Fimbriimonadaceae bacterium]QYK55532.1 MAG: SRPBCC family protein [Fimbriimonadaceae bacterium]
MNSAHVFNPELDLRLERVIDVAPEKVWAAWTEPELLKQWFTPRPWRTSEVDVDLRPGGKFRTLMEGPEGESFDGTGCYLEVVPNQRLVWTSALEPGYRPKGVPDQGFVFTALIELEPVPSGCKYTATVIHGNPQDKQQHEGMGFYDVWGKALDQLVEMVSARV